jgi:hypothetical protein
MTRHSRRWLGAVALLLAVAAGAILANFALLDAAAGDEPVGKLSPLTALTTAPGESGAGPAAALPPVSATIQTETVQSPSETRTTSSPDDDRDDDAQTGAGELDGDSVGDDRDD